LVVFGLLSWGAKQFFTHGDEIASDVVSTAKGALDRLEIETDPTRPSNGHPQSSASETGERVLVQIVASPRDARIYLDGEPSPSNPLALPRSNEPHEIEVIATGFEGKRLSVVANRAQTIRVRLKRSTPNAPPEGSSKGF
jgi:hypothetical protein